MGAYVPQPIEVPALPGPALLWLILGPYPVSMLGLIRLFLGSLVALFRPRADMAAENLALRHQLGILLWSRPARLPLTSWDRALWAFALQRFPGWRQSLAIVRPETFIAWHRQAFRLFWRWKSQAGRLVFANVRTNPTAFWLGQQTINASPGTRHPDS